MKAWRRINVNNIIIRQIMFCTSGVCITKPLPEILPYCPIYQRIRIRWKLMQNKNILPKMHLTLSCAKCSSFCWHVKCIANKVISAFSCLFYQDNPHNILLIFWFCHYCEIKEKIKPLKHDHYSDVIMGAMASQITSLTVVYSTVYSGADQRKCQSSASLNFVRGIHR